MGRLDDIIARNQQQQRGGSYRGLGVVGSAIDATLDPTDTPEDRKRKLMAWLIVGGILAAIAVVIAIAI